MFDFSNYSAKSKSYDDINTNNKLVVGKMKDETGGVAIEEFVRLKPKMYSLLGNDSSEHKKGKGVIKNVVVRIGHSKCRDVLLNNKCLMYLLNRIQSKNPKIGTYDINKISLSYFDDKIYILNNGYDGLALGYWS